MRLHNREYNIQEGNTNDPPLSKRRRYWCGFHHTVSKRNLLKFIVQWSYFLQLATCSCEFRGT